MESEKSIVKKINGLLNSNKTRREGLNLLNSHLMKCSNENFVECCVKWMQNCCKSNETSKATDLTLQVLSTLFKISAEYPELHKPVSFFITNRFFDHFFKYFVDSLHGWECAKNCFLYYRGPCGPSKDNIEKHLNEIIKKNKQISKEMSDCVALLPCLGGGGNEGVNYKTNWKSQFVKYINITHSILNELFVDVEELESYNTGNETFVSGEKYPSTQYLVAQLYNHCSILSSMLLIVYPTSKCISIDLLIELICRGLSINPLSLAKCEMSSLISLKKVLPDIQSIMLNVLNSTIALCGIQLLPYSPLICKLIKQMLDWTQSESGMENAKNVEALRISTYNALHSWLVATKSGSNVDFIANSVILHAISDVEIKTPVTLLKEKKSKKNKGSEVKQQNHSRQKPQSNACLSFSALKCLQSLLRYVGVFIKPEDHKLLQETVVKLLVTIYNSTPTGIKAPYSIAKCRKELFGVLLELVNQPCPKCPPPTHFGLRLFKTGENDTCPEVSQFCSSSLNALTVIIHQQFSNGPYLSSETRTEPKKNTINLIWRNEGAETNGTLEVEAPEETENAMDVDGETTSEKEEQTLDEQESSYASDEIERIEMCANEENSKSESPSSEKLSTPPEPSQKILENNEDVEENVDKSEEEVDVDMEKGDKSPQKNEVSVSESKSCKNTTDEHCPFRSEDEPLSKKCKMSNEEPFHSPGEIIKSTKSDDDVVVENMNSGTNSVFNDKEQVMRKQDVKQGETSEQGSDIEKSSPKNSNLEPASEQQNSNLEPASDQQNSDESRSEKSVTPDITDYSKYLDYKKRYFLRSKGTNNGGSEDFSQEPLKRTESVDSLRQTPTRGLGRNTPTSAARRPRTRALSKLENCDSEIGTPKKTDDDIIEVFNSAVKD